MSQLSSHDIQSSNTSIHTIHNLLAVKAQYHPQAIALTAPDRLPVRRTVWVRGDEVHSGAAAPRDLRSAAHCCRGTGRTIRSYDNRA